MNRARKHVLAIAPLCFGVFAAVPVMAAQVTQVSRGTWGASGVPSYVNMYIYVPDQLADKPPILVAHHSCGTPVSGYVNSIAGIRSAADRVGFILILPEATGRNCWDVGTAASLTHDGGGDTQAIAQMVKYALMQYDGDAERVYAMGGSSGAMMTQALMAVYPDIFKAGSARAGVPAGCWADGFDSGQQWSGNCAGGRTTKSAMQWGDQARGMFSGYTGPRRRMQLFHGTNDTTISYNNYGEAIKQWTNVLELPTTPTSTDDVMTSVATYDRQYWENECGFTVLETWAGRNGTHSMAYEEDAILEFFGLDEARDADPEPACPGGAGGSGGMGGASGTGGAAGVGGGSGAGAAGGAGGSAGNAGGSTGGGENGGSAGMTAGSAGSVAGAGAGGLPGSGGSGVSGSAGAGVSGGTAGRTGSGGAPGTAGNAVSGGSAGRATGGSAGSATAGTTSGGGAEAEETPQRELDCGCVVVGGGRSTNGYAVLAALGLAFAAFRRRGTGRRR